jgi:hypothetical protein
VILAVMIGGCGGAPARALPDPPPGPPPPAPLINVPRLQVCVVQGGRLAEVVTDFNGATGDTLVSGRPFHEVFPTEPPAYARSARWLILNTPIVVRGLTYLRYGLPREIPVALLEPAGEFEGTPLFIEAGTGDRTVLYIPFSTGCVFQPYQTTTHGGAVRG